MQRNTAPPPPIGGYAVSVQSDSETENLEQESLRHEAESANDCYSEPGQLSVDRSTQQDHHPDGNVTDVDDAVVAPEAQGTDANESWPSDEERMAREGIIGLTRGDSDGSDGFVSPAARPFFELGGGLDMLLKTMQLTAPSYPISMSMASRKPQTRNHQPE